MGSILKFRIGFSSGKEFCWILQVRVASEVDTEFPYRARIVDRGSIAATLFAATVSNFQQLPQQPGVSQVKLPLTIALHGGVAATLSRVALHFATQGRRSTEVYSNALTFTCDSGRQWERSKACRPETPRRLLKITQHGPSLKLLEKKTPKTPNIPPRSKYSYCLGVFKEF